MYDEQLLVKVFHTRHGFPIHQRLDAAPSELDGHVKEIARACLETADTILKARMPDADLRLARLQLIIEEVGELAKAMHERDEIELADALADLAYVVVGTAVAYGMPLKALFHEVHRSNMTKTVGGHKPWKGEEFSAPRIAEVLARHRVS